MGTQPSLGRGCGLPLHCHDPLDAAVLLASGFGPIRDSGHNILAGTKRTEMAHKDAVIRTTKVRAIDESRDTRQRAGTSG